MSGYKIKFNGIDRLYDQYSWRLTRRAKQVWQTGQVLQGNYLKEFEIQLAKKYKRKYAVAVASATDGLYFACLLYTSPSPRDRQKSRMPSSA